MSRWYHGTESGEGEGDYNFTGVVGNTDAPESDGAGAPDQADSSRSAARLMTGIRHYGKGRININQRGGRSE